MAPTHRSSYSVDTFQSAELGTPVAPTSPHAAFSLPTPNLNSRAADPMSICTPERQSMIVMDSEDEFLDPSGSSNSLGSGPGSGSGLASRRHSCNTSETSGEDTQDLSISPTPVKHTDREGGGGRHQGGPLVTPVKVVTHRPLPPLRTGKAAAPLNPLDSLSCATVKLRIISASGLHQSHLFQAMAPCAVVSLPNRKERFVTKPARHGADTYPVWNALATFRVHGSELTQLSVRRRSSIAEQHVAQLKQPPMEFLRKMKINNIPRWRPGVLQCASPAATMPEEGELEEKEIERERVRKLRQVHGSCLLRPTARRNSFSEPGILPPPGKQQGKGSELCVVIDIYSSPKLKKHLGRVVVPLTQALSSSMPNKPVAGSYEVVRKVFPGRLRTDGELKVMINVQLDSL